ncbi:hypothetical protein [Paludibaculum fermentans]|uniref:Secreted protein n=1 Tax=Paludibaculum fermentans TaxID=1473598 RepID=A0A7S7NVK0_PALFE|nr:hypothetical protein [Paludibaculum fermentans]QOY90586.1 hypothetical protein IRI77_11750 [Paludibaculum fermentans]
MSRTTLIRLIAVLLLLIAGAEVFACDITDPCITSAASPSAGCDQPLGDNCLCCCHHIVPAATVTLDASEYVADAVPPRPTAHAASMSLPIEHPPQL